MGRDGLLAPCPSACLATKDNLISNLWRSRPRLFSIISRSALSLATSRRSFSTSSCSASSYHARKGLLRIGSLPAHPLRNTFTCSSQSRAACATATPFPDQPASHELEPPAELASLHQNSLVPKNTLKSVSSNRQQLSCLRATRAFSAKYIAMSALSADLKLDPRLINNAARKIGVTPAFTQPLVKGTFYLRRDVERLPR